MKEQTASLEDFFKVYDLTFYLNDTELVAFYFIFKFMWPGGPIFFQSFMSEKE